MIRQGIRDKGPSAYGGPVTEIHDLAELESRLASGSALSGMRLQGLDLRGHADLLLGRTDLAGVAVLGGRLPARLVRHLIEQGAVVFPEVPDAPVDPYRAVLYHPSELYASLSRGYDSTPDARAYHWTQDAVLSRDALVTALRALHDDAMSDALEEALDGYPTVGVMGGHGVTRDSAAFASAARLGARLVEAGAVVLTGGGPGAMEAANLGAYAVGQDLDAALHALARVPDFRDIDAWASVALQVRGQLDTAAARSERGVSGHRTRSVGVPTWFYGHEPPNVFCDGIAKYFSNAVREDELLAHSTAGVVVLPGAAGTVQEIFQAVTPRYYDTGLSPVAALVLVGRRHWTETVPVWPLLQTLAAGRAFSSSLHLVDGIDEVAGSLGLN